MIHDFVSAIAVQMGVSLTRVSIVEGVTAGCYDLFLLHLTSGTHLVHALVYQSELDDVQNGSTCDQLEVRIRIALARLRSLTGP
jgi:hypothetical protein